MERGGAHRRAARRSRDRALAPRRHAEHLASRARRLGQRPAGCRRRHSVASATARPPCGSLTRTRTVLTPVGGEPGHRGRRRARAGLEACRPRRGPTRRPGAAPRGRATRTRRGVTVRPAATIFGVDRQRRGRRAVRHDRDAQRVVEQRRPSESTLCALRAPVDLARSRRRRRRRRCSRSRACRRPASARPARACAARPGRCWWRALDLRRRRAPRAPGPRSARRTRWRPRCRGRARSPRPSGRRQPSAERRRSAPACRSGSTRITLPDGSRQSIGSAPASAAVDDHEAAVAVDRDAERKVEHGRAVVEVRSEISCWAPRARVDPDHGAAVGARRGCRRRRGRRPGATAIPAGS